MSTLQELVNNVDMSDKIYRDIMTMNGNKRRPRSNRASSAKSATSTQFSFFASSPNSAKSAKTIPNTVQVRGSYTDVDIIKSKSWSGSKVKSGTSLLSASTKRSDRCLRSEQPSPLPTSHSLVLLNDRVQRSSNSVPTLEGKGGPAQGKSWWLTKGCQVQRLHQEWAAIEHCRSMKRASEMVQHRLDPMYQLSGSNVPLLERYHVDETELQRLRVMSSTSRLQNDLKRTKYPHGLRNGAPRSARISSQQEQKKQKPQETADKPAETASTNNSTTEETNHHEAADPPTRGESLVAPPEAAHPSPVTSPDGTPRPQPRNPEETNGEQAEATKQVNQGDIFSNGEQVEEDGEDHEDNT